MAAYIVVNCNVDEAAEIKTPNQSSSSVAKVCIVYRLNYLLAETNEYWGGAARLDGLIGSCIIGDVYGEVSSWLGEALQTRTCGSTSW